MAKTKTASRAAETLRPYVQRALTDPEFREDLAAVAAARGLYGQLAKTKRAGHRQAASCLATDARSRSTCARRSRSSSAAGTLKGKKKKSHKGRNAILLAGVVLGVLYNPWTGQQTRDWILDQVAGDDDLQPLEASTFPTWSIRRTVPRPRTAAADDARTRDGRRA